MANEVRADLLEAAFRLARSGDREAFAEWMGMVEIPLRRSLSRFARAVDVEVVMQETLLRMWLVARVLSDRSREPTPRSSLQSEWGVMSLSRKCAGTGRSAW